MLDIPWGSYMPKQLLTAFFPSANFQKSGSGPHWRGVGMLTLALYQRLGTALVVDSHCSHGALVLQW